MYRGTPSPCTAKWAHCFGCEFTNIAIWSSKAHRLGKREAPSLIVKEFWKEESN